jgi:mRNA interferase MazF
MAPRFGDVVLIAVQFHQAQGSKIRPAVVIPDSGEEDFVAAPVTSRPGMAEFDLVLQDWRDAGLNVASTVRPHKIAVLSKANIGRSVGSLAPDDLASVHVKLCRAFCADHV